MNILMFVLGAALGSFSLVLAWRMHDKKDWVIGRSKCDYCHKELGVADLIPVVSWLILGGKCRHCKRKLPLQLLLAEAGLGLSVALSYVYWPYQLLDAGNYVLFSCWIVLLVLASALFWYDQRWLILPNKLVYPMIYLSLVFVAIRHLSEDLTVYDGLFLPLMAAGLLSGFFFMLNSISKGRWIGFGDVRLAVALGLITGSPLNVWIMLFSASIVGVLVAFPGIISKKKSLNSKLPFGPLLLTATVFVVLANPYIIDLYWRSLGI